MTLCKDAATHHNAARLLDDEIDADTDFPGDDDTDTVYVIEDVTDDLSSLELDFEDALYAGRETVDAVDATPDAKTCAATDASGATPPESGDLAAGPVIAELVATRAELRRVEGELRKAGDDLEDAEQERTQLRGAHARLYADFENFRRRSERTRAETHQAILGEIVSYLLPVADNFRRATQITPFTAAMALGEEPQHDAGLQREEFRQFALGVELIRNQLDDVLHAYGVEAVPSIGELFDPHVHEAIATESSADHAPNMIIEEIVRGYRLGDKLLRPALVKVAAP